MNIQFERFSEKYIDEAVRLALAELQAERVHCPELPCHGFEERLREILWWLGSQSFGKAAVCDGKLVGYLLFAGPWDGFHGDVKGVFSPLGGSAFSHAYENRGKLASMLFAEVAQEFAAEGIYSCALCRYAHDEEVVKSFLFNGFGIRCMDAVREMDRFTLQNTSRNVVFEELPKERFCEVEHLQRGLHRHLLHAPVFFPLPGCGFEAWFSEWISRETMRIFVAKADGKVVGFISVDEYGENFITEYDRMKNICGAYFMEEYRGNGIAQGLLAFIRDTLMAEEVTHLGVDCETMNPTALRFWTKNFIPYTYSFARRIDERAKVDME